MKRNETKRNKTQHKTRAYTLTPRQRLRSLLFFFECECKCNNTQFALLYFRCVKSARAAAAIWRQCNRQCKQDRDSSNLEKLCACNKNKKINSNSNNKLGRQQQRRIKSKYNKSENSAGQRSGSGSSDDAAMQLSADRSAATPTPTPASVTSVTGYKRKTEQELELRRKQHRHMLDAGHSNYNNNNNSCINNYNYNNSNRQQAKMYYNTNARAFWLHYRAPLAPMTDLTAAATTIATTAPFFNGHRVQFAAAAEVAAAVAAAAAAAPCESLVLCFGFGLSFRSVVVVALYRVAQQRKRETKRTAARLYKQTADHSGASSLMWATNCII